MEIIGLTQRPANWKLQTLNSEIDYYSYMLHGLSNKHQSMANRKFGFFFPGKPISDF